MDIYGDFLEKLTRMSEKNPKMNLKNFVDHELSRFYEGVLMQHQQTNKDANLDGIDDLLKKFNNQSLKKTITLNYYFDHVYVLNLDRRPDRLEKMRKSLAKVGIYNWTRFKAIDGKDSPHYDEWSNYRRTRMTFAEKSRFNRKAIGSAGSWAILKSTYLMIKDAMKNKYKNFLVLQDDMLFHKNFVEEFLKIPATVPSNWKILYLGATQHNWNHCEFRSQYYFPMGTADGAFAVGLHHSTYKDMLDEIMKFDMPVDSGALKTLQRKYGRQALALTPNLMIADIRDSDLRKSRDLNAYSKRFRWNIKLYDLS